MNTKLILAATALITAIGATTSIASAKPLWLDPGVNCQITNTCPVFKPIQIPQKPVLIPYKPIKLPLPTPMPLPTPPKPKGPDINVNLDLGGGYGGGYDGGYGGDYGDGISCGEGKSIVRHHGFKKVRAIDCSGSTFTYVARKHGQRYEVDVNMDGDIVDVSDASY